MKINFNNCIALLLINSAPIFAIDIDYLELPYPPMDKTAYCWDIDLLREEDDIFIYTLRQNGHEFNNNQDSTPKKPTIMTNELIRDAREYKPTTFNESFKNLYGAFFFSNCADK